MPSPSLAPALCCSDAGEEQGTWGSVLLGQAAAPSTSASAALVPGDLWLPLSQCMMQMVCHQSKLAFLTVVSHLLHQAPLVWEFV